MRQRFEADQVEFAIVKVDLTIAVAWRVDPNWGRRCCVVDLALVLAHDAKIPLQSFLCNRAFAMVSLQTDLCIPPVAHRRLKP